jgi:hypothetical protein
MTRLNIREAVLVIITLTLAYSGAAQDKVVTATTASSETRAVANTETPSGPHEGIKVHGHWAIDVRNADGTLVSHTEFENALALPGTTLLTEFLGRTSIAGNWLIFLTDGGNLGACGSGVNNPPMKCVITESNDPGNANLIQTNTLIVSTTPSTTSKSAQLILTGNTTAMFNSSVAVVETGLAHCKRTPTTIPTICTIYGSNPTFLGYETFSHASLTTPVSVNAGQIIQIMITFTFS